jgi:hypothetical protein
LHLGYISEAWRKVRVIFIPKPGKDTSEEPKSYRAISLTSIILKVSERLIDRYLMDVCLQKYPFEANQHAYQKGKSTNFAIHQVTQFIESGLDSGESILSVFLDVEGAFDRTIYSAITNSLREHGVPLFLIEWMGNMLKSRVLTAELRDAIILMFSTLGCPQGGILSSLFWILIANSLLKLLKNACFFTVGYADDFVILIKGKFINTLFERMQEALNIVENGAKG